MANKAKGAAASKQGLKGPRRRKAKGTEVTAGKAKEVDSFLCIENPESTIAAYLNFTDVGEFRRFCLSPFVLPHYINSLPFKSANHKKTLGLLIDAPDTYWASDNEPCKVYPMDGLSGQEAKSMARYGLGLVAWQMVRAFRAKRKGVLHGIGSDTKLLNTDFAKKTGCTVPPIKKPFTADRIPDLGPLDGLGESDMEPLNRCLCLLAHLKHVTSPSQWRLRYTGTWARSSQISDDWIPDWMRTRDEGSKAPAELADEFTSGIAGTKPPHDVQVTWNHKAKSPHNVEFVTSVGPDGLDELDSMPKTTFVTLEHGMTGPAARDRIREAFKLDQTTGQIQQLRLCVQTDDEDDQKTLNALVADWDSIQDIIWTHDTRDTRLRFTMLLRCRNADEICWESETPPPALRPFLQAEQGDVAPLQVITEVTKAEVEQKVSQLTAPTGQETTFDPVREFNNNKKRIKAFYNGHEVTTPAGRQKWQLHTLSQIAGYMEPYREDAKVTSFHKFTDKEAAVLSTAFSEGTRETVNLEDDDDPDAVDVGRDRYYALQATTATQACVGPPIELSIRALQMRASPGADEFYIFNLYDSSKVKRGLRSYQVNGTAWCVSRLVGITPSKQPDMSAADWSKAKAAAKKLQNTHVPGLLIADGTGLGKTVLLLSVLLHCHGPINDNGKLVFKPLFLQVPQNLIRQWAREILDYWPAFELIISYSDTSMDTFLADHVVSASAVREWPDPKLWPKRFRYIFNPKDARNGRTIFLTTPETHVSRSLKTKEIFHPAIPYTPPVYDIDNNEVMKDPERTEHIYESGMVGAFSIVCTDEASKLKNLGTKRHTATSLLKAPKCILLTATPMLNTGTVCSQRL